MIETTSMKLDRDAQFQVSESAIRSILTSYKAKLISFHVAPSGIENTTVLVKTTMGDFALRIYRQNRKEEKTIIPELDFMDYLRDHGIPIPEIIRDASDERIVLYKEEKGTWHCILMRWMAGEHPKVYTSALLLDMALIQAKMHDLGAAFAKTGEYERGFADGRLIGKDLLRHVDMTKITNPEIKDFLARVEQFAVDLPAGLPTGFNHLDYDHANVLAVGDKVSAVLDFDDVQVTPIAICFGYTLWDVLSRSKSFGQVREYLNYYSSVRSLSQAEFAVLKDVMLFRNYIVASIQLGFWGENNNKVKERIEIDKLMLEFKL